MKKFCFGVSKQKHLFFTKVVGSFLVNNTRCSIYDFKGGKLVGLKKGKAISLQAWTGLVGSSRLRLPDFKTIGT